jgi:hypothetical protein
MKIFQQCISKTKCAFCFVCLTLFLLPGTRCYSQYLAGISGGLGVGNLTHRFTQYGETADFSFSAPGATVSLECVYNRVFFDMMFDMLFAPFEETLGGYKIDRTGGYKTNLAMDFSVNIGYLFPVNERLSVGSGLGFHVSSPILSPRNESDYEKVAFGGSYGLIGLALSPRVRYSLSENIKLTLSVPLGIDLGASSDRVIVGGIDYGSSPTIVRPYSLIPKYKGFTSGVFLSVGYFIVL